MKNTYKKAKKAERLANAEAEEKKAEQQKEEEMRCMFESVQFNAHWCNYCGAVVADAEVHHAWHKRTGL